MVAEAVRLYDPLPRLREKIGLLSAQLTGQPLDWTVAPFADVDLLQSVRNFLVHQRPELIETDAGERKEQKLVNRLVERGVVSRRPKGVIEGTVGVLSEPAVGRWAFNSALAAIQAIAAMFPERGWGDKLLFQYHGLEPIP